ncbi:hypothetical protein [Dechloromonas sp. TW-R-39-2]|uniref:hypothetical protein n=1 Tax=Dechloromonas sp. TW-R-39-2 TaxID=2654218 RepID=UPI00193CD066|nr:hypothetical protein [Dechloromonas sp. TW-R-39-2]
MAKLTNGLDDEKNHPQSIAKQPSTRNLIPDLTKLFGGIIMTKPNVELTGAARLYRAASSDRRERG